MNLLRKILFPVVPFYHLATWLRNKAFDSGFLESRSYGLPIITVGNLSVGGTGKTPMVEYLIRLLKDEFFLATLSRGYKRKTKGFIKADKEVSVESIGDEPFQIYNKFNDISVSVDVDRQNGISQLLNLKHPPEVILLDDALQHRKVKAGLNILLTAYDNLYIKDFVLPTGNLREPISGAKRADVVVVTKCPDVIDELEKQSIRFSLKLSNHQRLFFSTINYAHTIYSQDSNKPLTYLKEKSFTLVTGIANANPLLEFLNIKGLNFEHLNFKDHHDFTDNDLKELNTKSFILTTEKDFVRIKDKITTEVYYLPIQISICESEIFDRLIKNFVTNF